MGYAFAEYHSVDAAIAAKKKSEELGAQCTVSSKRFTVTFPHGGVFPLDSIPGVTGPTPEKFLIEMRNEDEKHRYWDERYYPEEFLVNEEAPTTQTVAPSSSTSTTTDVVAGVKRGPETLESTMSKAKKAKKPAGTVAPLSELQKWQNKSAELRRDVEQPAQTPAGPASDANSIIIAASTEEKQTFAINRDDQKSCYLCNTTFTSANTLMRHLHESETHAASAADQQKVERGFARLKKKGIDPDQTIKLTATPTESQPQWRDRAAERRHDAGQAGAQKLSFSLKPNAASAKSRSSSPSASDGSKPAYGKGLGMLQKAGWTEGQGLGADQKGISAPIAQDKFAAGVGLGHTQSKMGNAVEEAAKLTTGDFQEATRENARKRYESLQ